MVGIFVPTLCVLKKTRHIQDKGHVYNVCTSHKEHIMLTWSTHGRRTRQAYMKNTWRRRGKEVMGGIQSLRLWFRWRMRDGPGPRGESVPRGDSWPPRLRLSSHRKALLDAIRENRLLIQAVWKAVWKAWSSAQTGLSTARLFWTWPHVYGLLIGTNWPQVTCFVSSDTFDQSTTRLTSTINLHWPAFTTYHLPTPHPYSW